MGNATHSAARGPVDQIRKVVASGVRFANRIVES
jgi:hypothetical protein